MNFLGLKDKTIVVFGLANRKSVAWHVGQVLRGVGAQVVYVVRTQNRRSQVETLVGDAAVFVCDVESEEQINALRDSIAVDYPRLHGIVHSVAFAEYEEGMKPFHETSKNEFLRAVDISCYSLLAISGAFKTLLDPDASVVTISISTTRMASENYGYMGPVKAALDSSLAFLAKSFSSFSRVRFNAVAPALLKTSASAGIPGYVDSYLYAEQVIPRKQAVQTEEVASVVAFLLSDRASGINAQQIIVDAGMSINYFDRDIIRKTLSGQNS